jgi:hypothetical protein
MPHYDAGVQWISRPETVFVFDQLASISEVTLVLKQGGPNQSDVPFMRMKKFSPLQEKALKLLEGIPKYPPL